MFLAKHLQSNISIRKYEMIPHFLAANIQDDTNTFDGN